MNLAARKKFIRILRIELEDLRDHIEQMVEDNRERLAQHQETEHVCFENVAVLRNEDGGVRCCLALLDSMDVEAYDSLDDIVDTLKTAFRKKARAYGFAEAACLFAERKMDRVRRYVTHDAEPYTGSEGILRFAR